MAWFDGLEADSIAHIQARGWDKIEDAAEVAREAAKAHLNATKLVGVQPELLLKLPKDAADPTYKAVYERVAGMAAPADASGYTFEGIKFADGADVSAEFAQVIRDVAAANKLPVHVAQEIAKGLVAFTDKESASGAAAAKTSEEAARGANRVALAAKWGADREKNEWLANKGREMLGLPEAFLAEAEKAGSYVNTMDALRIAGSRLSEATYHGGPPKDVDAAMNGAQATERLEALKKDEKWVERWMARDVKTVEEFNHLTQLIAAERVPQYAPR